MHIFVKTINGETITLADASETVDSVKENIEEVEGIPVNYQHLVFEGSELENGCDLSYYNVQEGSSIHLFLNLLGGSWKMEPHLRKLAIEHTLNKQICRKCYGRLSPRATRCHKAKCGRTTNIRPKKKLYY